MGEESPAVPQLHKHFTWEYQVMQQLTIMTEIKKLLLEKERVMIQTRRYFNH